MCLLISAPQKPIPQFEVDLAELGILISQPEGHDEQGDDQDAQNYDHDQIHSILSMSSVLRS